VVTVVDLAERSKLTQSDVLESYQAKLPRFRNSGNVEMSTLSGSSPIREKVVYGLGAIIDA